MTSMYEVIMDLPLFKGISPDQVSSFIEKTHLDFRKFETGEPLCEQGAECTSLLFLIKGHARCVFSIPGLGLEVSSTMGPGSLIGGDTIFGWDTRYRCAVSAIDRVETMSVRKDQYVALLGTNDIYLINYANFLSLRSQRSMDSIMTWGNDGLLDILSLLVTTLTPAKADDISIKADVPVLARLAGLTPEEVGERLLEMTREGVADYSNGLLTLRSRSDFLDYCDPQKGSDSDN